MCQSSRFNLKNDVRHLPGRDTSLRGMYASHGVPMKASTDGRSKKNAITIASVDRIILPLSSMSDVLGGKDRLTFSRMFRNGTSVQQIFISIEKEQGAQPPSIVIRATRNSIRAKIRIFLQSNEFIKFDTINGPTDIVRSFLNTPQDIFVLVMPRAFDAGLKNGFPILTKPFS